jgi:hypothetical protein
MISERFPLCKVLQHHTGIMERGEASMKEVCNGGHTYAFDGLMLSTRLSKGCRVGVTADIELVDVLW